MLQQELLKLSKDGISTLKDEQRLSLVVKMFEL